MVWRNALHDGGRAVLQVWKDALAQKQQSPYMRHTLSGGTLRDMRFCPYEVTAPSFQGTYCPAVLLLDFQAAKAWSNLAVPLLCHAPGSHGGLVALLNQPAHVKHALAMLLISGAFLHGGRPRIQGSPSTGHWRRPLARNRESCTNQFAYRDPQACEGICRTDGGGAAMGPVHGAHARRWESHTSMRLCQNRLSVGRALGALAASSIDPKFVFL